MRFQWTGVLLILALMMAGCWDTVMTLRPGETVELEDIAIGDDYVVEGCEVRRVAPGAVVIDAASLSIFEDARADRNQAKRRYLNRAARVTGLVSDVTDFDGLADEVEITVTPDGKKVNCGLKAQLTEAELNALFGKTVTLEGFIDDVWRFGIYLYDCEIVEVPE